MWQGQELSDCKVCALLIMGKWRKDEIIINSPVWWTKGSSWTRVITTSSILGEVVEDSDVRLITHAECTTLEAVDNSHLWVSWLWSV